MVGALKKTHLEGELVKERRCGVEPPVQDDQLGLGLLWTFTHCGLIRLDR